MTMPGLAEELTIRGVELGILNHYLGRPWRALGCHFGWGAIIITLLFIIGHIFLYNSLNNSIEFKGDWINIYTLFISIALVYIREKTGSIWPGVLLHNLCNTLSFAMAWTIYKILF